MLFSCIATTAFASYETHLVRPGNEGLENWAKLNLEFATHSGKNQLPIHLTAFIDAQPRDNFVETDESLGGCWLPYKGSYKWFDPCPV